ncbi:MAG: hypothetical protein AAFN93_01595 [Bacteroidota bacterium]
MHKLKASILDYLRPPSVLMILLSGLLVNTNISAQDTEDKVSKMPAQITFLYPLGSNGIRSYEVVNNLSINVLAGISGGVDGVEVGGLANFSRGDIRGSQFAGLVNSSLGDLNGVQAAGLVNFNKGHIDGVQVAGLVNSGLKTVRGAQIAGLVNAPVKDIDGIQVAGLVNVGLGNVNGSQISGLANVAVKRVTGSQIGLVNYTGKLKGFQIGLINVADSVEDGAGFGLITYYRNGYHRFEIGATETFYANVSFKSGVEKFYLIYTVGFKTENNRSFWAPGVGFGTLFKLNNKLAFNTDFIASQVNEDEWWTNELNMLNTMKVNFAYDLNDRLSFYGGPTFNVVVSGIRDRENNVVGDSFSPSWDFFDRIGSNNRVKMYIGLTGGIRF